LRKPRRKSVLSFPDSFEPPLWSSTDHIAQAEKLLDPAVLSAKFAKQVSNPAWTAEADCYSLVSDDPSCVFSENTSFKKSAFELDRPGKLVDSANLRHTYRSAISPFSIHPASERAFAIVSVTCPLAAPANNYIRSFQVPPQHNSPLRLSISTVRSRNGKSRPAAVRSCRLAWRSLEYSAYV
jgi:hypothetical protein